MHNHKDYVLLANGNYWEPTNTFSYSSQSNCIKWLDITVHRLLKNLKDIWSAAALIPQNAVQLHIVLHWYTLGLACLKDGSFMKWNKIWGVI